MLISLVAASAVFRCQVWSTLLCCDFVTRFCKLWVENMLNTIIRNIVLIFQSCEMVDWTVSSYDNLEIRKYCETPHEGILSLLYQSLPIPISVGFRVTVADITVIIGAFSIKSVFTALSYCKWWVLNCHRMIMIIFLLPRSKNCPCWPVKASCGSMYLSFPGINISTQ